MKSKFIKLTVLVMFAIVAGYNVYQVNQEKERMSDIVLANVEALADEESEFIQVCPIEGGSCNVLIGGQMAVVVAGWQK